MACEFAPRVAARFDPERGGVSADAPRAAPRFERRVPEGDSLERRVCADCGFIDYENPKIVAGVVAADGQGRILLCRRAIQPSRGLWTLPAGFLEAHEAVEDGARRETWEEARAKVTLESVLAVYSIPRISQVQVLFRARLISDFAPGEESLDVDLFDWEHIPWEEIAFPSVRWALRHYREGDPSAPAFLNPPDMAGVLGD